MGFYMVFEPKLRLTESLTALESIFCNQNITTLALLASDAHI